MGNSAWSFRIYIYQNENSLLFGYLYENELNQELYNKLSQEQKDVALTAGFYYTEKGNGSQEHKFNQADINKNNISMLRNGVYSVSYANNLYQAKVYNLYESDSMLCIPIFLTNPGKLMWMVQKLIYRI